MRPSIRRPHWILALAIVLSSTLPGLLIAQQPANGNQPKHILRMEWFYAQRQDAGGEIPVETYHRERRQAVADLKLRGRQDMQRKMAVPAPATTLTWSEVGPGSVSGNWPTHWGNTSGRVRAIAVHPTDPNTVFIGAAAGGIWKTTDGGTSWNDVGYDFASLTFGAIAIDPNNPNTVYAGSGEARYMYNKVTYGGEGLYKSTDGGSTWTNITDGFGNYTHFSDIQVSPHNSNIVMATLSAGYWHAGYPPNMGVWRSTDAGTTWNNAASVAYVFDIAIHPTDPNIMFAAATGGVMRSTDAGATWGVYGSGLPAGTSIGRMHLSLVNSSPSTMYAVNYNGSDSTTAWKSTDGGANWSQISTGVPLGGNYGSGWTDQGGYDLCIAASPTDANRVFIGNVEMHATTNGSDFSPVRVSPGTGAWQCPIHVDIHTFAFAPSNSSILYAGCDGGIYKSTDAGSTWSSVNAALPTLQLYRISSHPTSRDVVLGGAQDNGNFMKSSSGTGAWNFLTTGDGMVSMFDYNTPNTMYFTTQYGSLYKSTNGGTTYSKVENLGGAWVTPIVMHPTTPTTLYAATTDFKRSTDGGVNWTIIASSIATGNVQALAVSPVNASNFIIAGNGDYNSSPAVKISTNAGATWTTVTSNIGGSARYISAVEADPNDGSTFYVVRSGFSPGNKIYKTTDLGATWTNISGDLPNVPHSAFFADPDNSTQYYAGNDLGVYRTTNGGTSWVHEGDGMPIVPVIDFAYSEIGAERILRAATHGRSVFEVNIGTPCTAPTVTTNPTNTTVCSGINAQFTAAASGSAPLTVQWERSANGSTWNIISGAVSTMLTIPTYDSLNGWQYRAVFDNACGTVTTAAALLTVNTAPAVATQPADQSVCQSDNTTFSVAGSGSPAPSVQWQESPDGSTWGNMTGETSNDLTLSATLPRNGYQYRAVLTNTCGSATSNAATLTVGTGPAFTSHPSDKTVCDGASVTFTAAATDADTWQWQNSSDGLTFTDMTGETSPSLTFNAASALDGYYYRTVATNTCGSTPGSMARLTINASVSIALNPQNVTLCDSGNVRLVAKATGTPAPTVQWEQSPDGSAWTPILTATDTAYTFYATSLNDGVHYRAVFTATCGILTSTTAIVTVNTAAVVSTHPADVTTCAGDTAYFSISTSGIVSAVQWQQRPNAGTWSDIPGGTGMNLNLTGLTPADDGTDVRAIVTNTCGNDTSNTALLTVTQPATVVQHPLSFGVCDGTTVTFKASATGPYTSVAWEYSTDGSVYQIVPGETDTALAVTGVFAESGYRYRAVFSDACGERRTNFGTLTVNMPPAITENPQDATVCTGTEAVFSVAASGSPAPFILWQNSPDGSVWSPIAGETADTLRIAVSQALNGYRYRAIVSNLCAADTSLEALLNVSTGFSVAASADVAVCSGTDVQLDVQTTGGAEPFVYYWSPLTGLTDAGINNPVASPVTTTTYTVTVTDANGCVAMDSVTVTIQSKPTAHAGADAVVCSGSGVPLGAPATGGTPPYLYSWSPSSGLSSDTAMSPMASPVTTTVYTVTVMDANGCSATDQVTVDVNPSPVAEAGEDRFVCVGSNTIIGESATGGTPPFTYDWTPATGLDAYNVVSPVASPAVTTTYHVFVTDALGCTAQDSVTLTVSPRPIANAGKDSAVCKGIAVPIGGAATNGTPPYSYVWTPSTGLDNPNIATPMASPFTSTSYTLTVVDAAGCTSTDQVMVKIFNAPVALAGSDATICAGEEVIIGNNAIGGTKPYTYVWTPAVGLSNPRIAKPIATPGVTTAYTVTVTDSAGCTSVDQMTVTVYPQPTVNAGGDKAICKGGSAPIGGMATGGTAPYTYAWFPPAGLSDPHSPTPVAKPDETTMYSLTVTDAKGCITADDVMVEIVPLAEPHIYSDKSPVICEGETITLAVTDTFTSYLWSNGATTPTITVDKPGQYYVIVSNSLNCRDTSKPIIVSVNPIPAPVIAGPAAVCPDTQATYYLVERNGISYEWSVIGGTMLTDTYGGSVRVQWTQIGGGTVTVTATNNVTGCSQQNIMPVQVSPTFTPVVKTGGALEFCEGRQVVLDAGAGYDTYLWSNGEVTQQIAVKTTGSYTVKVTLPSGCSGTSDPVNVNVIPFIEPVISSDGPLTLCEGSTRVLDAGPGYAAYKWNTGETTRKISVTKSGIYRVTTTNSFGCQGSSYDIKVNVVPIPDITITGNYTACQSTTVQYLAPTNNYLSYKWTVQGGYIAGRDDSSSVLVVWQSPGYGYVHLEADFAGMCTASKDQRILIYPMDVPVITVVGPSQVCEGSTVKLRASAGYASYRWTTGDTTQEITVSKSGVYYVEATSINGCKRRSEGIEAKVVPMPFSGILGPVRIKPGEEASFQAPILYGYTYQWSTGGGTIVHGKYGSKMIAVFDNEGPDSVTVTVKNSLGCTSTTTFRVEVTETYYPEISVLGPTTICEGDSVTLRGPEDARTFTWSTGATTESITVGRSGVYAVEITDKFGFKWDSEPVKIFVIPTPEPVITLYGPPEICEGDVLLLEAPAGYVSYQWSDGSGGRRAYVTTGGAYTVTVTNQYGCTGTSDPVIVRSRPSPPKPVITQNGAKLRTGDAVWYQWYRDGREIPDGTGQTLFTDVQGQYTVRVGGVNGCSRLSDPYEFHVIMTDVSVPLDIEGDAGDIIRIPIIFKTNDDLAKASALGFTVTLSFDPEVLTPLNAPYFDSEGLRYTTLQGTIAPTFGQGGYLKPGEEVPIAIFECMATLGTRDHTPVTIENISYADYHIGAYTTNGIFRLNICREGGDRLFDDNGRIALEQNRPNPFNTSTSVEYEIIERGLTRLYVMDMMGRRIKTLVDARMEPGRYSITFDLGDVPTGSYIYVLHTPTQVRYNLMELVK